jgi:hypothetical protein
MSISNTDLDVAFFEKNYDVLDLDTGRRYKDFTSLQTAQVACIAECHHTSVLHRLQYETLCRLGKIACCVLLEGLSPGQVLEQSPGWEGLPKNLSLWGSDVRLPTTAEDFITWHEKIQKAKRLILEKFENHQRLVRQQAAILNEALKSHEAVIFTEKNRVAVSPALLKQIEALKPKKNRELDCLKKEIRQEQKKDLDSVQETQLKSSNEGLFQEIQKALKQFPRVIPIWGLNHFVLGEEMFAALRKAHITYIILVPSKKNLKQAVIESSWKDDTFDTVSLKLNDTKLKIPKNFEQFFHPSIPFRCRPIIKAKVFDSLKLLELFKHQKGPTLQWTWPAKTLLHFKEISTDTFIKLGDDFGEGSHLRKTPPSLDSLVDSLNDMLLLGNRRITVIPPIRDSSLDISPSLPLFEKQYLAITSKYPLVFKIKAHESVGTATHLFQEMKRLSRDFELKPGSWTLFLDIIPKALKKILKDPATQFEAWLQSRAPKNMRVIFEGNIHVAQGTYTNSTQKVAGLRISTEKGAKFYLQAGGRHRAQKWPAPSKSG